MIGALVRIAGIVFGGTGILGEIVLGASLIALGMNWHIIERILQ